MPTVSIVIPVYNVSTFLEKCIDSILEQTFKNFTIFLIDDGSTDTSGKICDEYSEKYAFITTIHNSNQGVSSTRQCGLDLAHSKYVTFVDPDDYLEPTFLENLLNIAESIDADIVWCDYYENKADTTDIHLCKTPSATRLEILNGILEGSFSAVLWNKLYKFSTIKDAGIRFCSDLQTAEDILFVTQVICQSHRFGYVNKPLYNYNMTNISSTINKYNEKKFREDYALMVSYMLPCLKAQPFYEQLYSNVIRTMFYCKSIYAFDSRYRDFAKYRRIYPEVDAHQDCFSEMTMTQRLILKCIAKHLNVFAYILLGINKIWRSVK